MGCDNSHSNESRTAILQLDHEGHRYVYVRHLVESGCFSVSPLVIITESGLASWHYGAHLAGPLRRHHAELKTVPDDMPHRDRLHFAAEVAIAAGCTRLIVPESDGLLFFLACAPRLMRERLELRYLVMRTPAGSIRSRLLLVAKYALALAISLRWRRSKGYFLTDSFGTVQRRALGLILQPLGDPAPNLPVVDRSAARRELGIGQGDFLIGILGGVSERKNPDLLLAALPGLAPHVRVLLAGKHSAGVSAAVDSLQLGVESRVISINHHLSDLELSKNLSACDAVALLHDLDGPSGILVSAASFGVKVLVGESKWLRSVVRRQRLGLAVRHTPASIARGIEALRSYPVTGNATPLASAPVFARRLLG